MDWVRKWPVYVTYFTRQFTVYWRGNFFESNSCYFSRQVYNSIVQPSSIHPRKVSRLQSTLDREIYSKALDASYLQASDSCDQQQQQQQQQQQRQEQQQQHATSSPKTAAKGRLIMSEPVNRGMLNFSLQVNVLILGLAWKTFKKSCIFTLRC